MINSISTLEFKFFSLKNGKIHHAIFHKKGAEHYIRTSNRYKYVIYFLKLSEY